MQMGAICCLILQQKAAATKEVISTAPGAFSSESLLPCSFLGAPVVVAVNSSLALRSWRSPHQLFISEFPSQLLFALILLCTHEHIRLTKGGPWQGSFTLKFD